MKTSPWPRQLCALPANARLLAVGRILFGGLALLYAYNYRDFVDTLWLDSPHLESARVLAQLWPWATLPLLLGFGGRVSALCHYMFVIVLLEMPDTTGTPEQIFFGNLAFTFVLTRASTHLSVDAWLRRRRQPTFEAPRLVPGWPLLLLGLSIGIQFGTSGLAKCFDPLWVHGKAFYYISAQPWIITPGWDSLLDWPGVLRALTWMALLFELSLLPLFLWSRTRWLAVLGLGVFGTAFFYPFTGMGLIGVFASLIAFLLASLLWATAATPSRPGPTHHHWERGVCVALLVLMLVQSTVALLPNALALTYPRLPEGLVMEGPPHAPGPFPRARIHIAQALWSLPGRQQVALLNQLTTRVYWLELFNVSHLFGLWTFRVEVELQDETQLEPEVVYSREQRSGPDNGWTTPRWLHPAMSTISALSNRRVADPMAAATAVESRWLDKLLRVPLTRLSAQQRDQVVESRILVASVAVPATEDRAWSRPAPQWQVLAWRTQGRAVVLNPALVGPSHAEIQLEPGKTLAFLSAGGRAGDQD